VKDIKKMIGSKRKKNDEGAIEDVLDGEQDEEYMQEFNKEKKRNDRKTREQLEKNLYEVPYMKMLFGASHPSYAENVDRIFELEYDPSGESLGNDTNSYERRRKRVAAETNAVNEECVLMPDAQLKTEIAMGFKPEDLTELRKKNAEMIENDTAEHTRLESILAVLKTPGRMNEWQNLFTDDSHHNASVKKDSCRLCRMVKVDLMGHKDTEKMDAMMNMLLYDLKYCGDVSEPQLMQSCTNIFNRTLAKNASVLEVPFLANVAEVTKHLLEHTNINIKRPLVQSINTTKALLAGAMGHINGTTLDGRKIHMASMGRNVLLYQDKINDYTQKLQHARVFVNFHYFNQVSSDFDQDPDVKKAGRHFMGRMLTGKFRKQNVEGSK
jgi:hypothetical protein